MNQILIETITPLHIGSGRVMQANTEYLYFKDTHEVSFIDESKILNLIGEANIDDWISIIENGEDLLDYIIKKSVTKSILPIDTSKRIMAVNGISDPKTGRSGIREQLFSGNGQPILPGSSLKGAVRTAIFNQVLLSSPNLVQVRRNRFKTVFDKVRKEEIITKIYSDKNIQAALFGKDPNHDIFRLLRIGDAHFQKTECILAETLNEKKTGQEIKKSVQQHIEAIPANENAYCNIQIPDDLIREIKKRPKELDQMKEINSLNNIPTIFSKINSHSKKLVEKEIKKYAKIILPKEASNYTKTLEDILEIYKNLTENQCIIRVGFGTGYLNMTGGWAEEQWENITDTNFEYKTEMNELSAAVHKNKRYAGKPLPKSRKMVLNGIPLGFLKLTLIDKVANTVNKVNLEKEVKNVITLQPESKSLPKPQTKTVSSGDAKKFLNKSRK